MSVINITPDIMKIESSFIGAAKFDNFIELLEMQSKIESSAPKELIEYKAPPTGPTPILFHRKVKPKRKGKTPRKKQNGYF